MGSIEYRGNPPTTITREQPKNNLLTTSGVTTLDSFSTTRSSPVIHQQNHPTTLASDATRHRSPQGIGGSMERNAEVTPIFPALYRPASLQQFQLARSPSRIDAGTASIRAHISTLEDGQKAPTVFEIAWRLACTYGHARKIRNTLAQEKLIKLNAKGNGYVRDATSSIEA